MRLRDRTLSERLGRKQRTKLLRLGSTWRAGLLMCAVVLALSGCASDHGGGAEGVSCDRFKLRTRLDGTTLVLSIETDLPDSAAVIVSVGRTYWKTDSPVAYSLDYFSEKSTVGLWRADRRISVASSLWRELMEQERVEMASLRHGFQVGSVSTNIKARAVVPINQPDTRFGDENRHLTGKAVRTTGIRVVEDEVEIPFPL